MDNFDLASSLQELGISEKDSLKIKSSLFGADLMVLIDCLRDIGRGQNLSKASSILGKYGVYIRSRSMNTEAAYLKAKYESLRDGQSLDETFGVMVRLGESFTYAIEINDQNRDRILDWLDENKVDYQATSPTRYNINCGDRDVAYRTGRALSNIIGKPTMRDSIESEITETKRKSTSRRIKAARDRMTKITPEDPNKLAMLTRSGKGVHNNGKDPRKNDVLGRGIKHKPDFSKEINESNLSEGVIGMKPLNPIFRLRELAGLPIHNNEDDIDSIQIADAPVIDPEGHLAAGPINAPFSGPVADPVDVIDPMPNTGMDNMDAPLDDPTKDMDGEIGDISDPIIDPMAAGAAGVPGDIGSDPIETIPDTNVPSQSDAMSQIEDNLNGIQTLLADIRLSEYKSLIKKLQDLTNQAQMMGRDYLGERRKK